MILYINNEELTGEENILDRLHKNGQAIGKIYINGQEYSGTWEQAVKEKGAREIKIETTTIEQLIEETKTSVMTYLPKLKEGINQVASLFQLGKETEAFPLMIDLVEGLDWLLQAIGAINIFNPGYLPEDEIISFNKKSEELIQAWKNDDFVLLSDLFEYEILPLIERWEEILR